MTAFDDWFYDGCVTDQQGRPLVVYHGTRRAFESFEAMHPRGAIGNPRGIYFTTSLSVAEEFAQDDDGALDETSRIVAAYLRIPSKADGYVIERPYDQEFVVFDPENVRTIPAKCLAFNPTLGRWAPEEARALSDGGLSL